jgi:CheY-like chemotaxis protein
MKVLVADDDDVNRKVLRALLQGEGHEVIEATNGRDALEELTKATDALVGLIDWVMPEIEGPEVCRKAKAIQNGPPLHLILLTGRNSQTDVVAGLQAGAADYVVKPFDRTELLARVNIGAQIVDLQRALTQHVKELQDALRQVKQLSGLLPICSYCKKIRDDKNYWRQVESYVADHTEVQFSHSICPHCYEEVVKPQMVRLGIEDEAEGEESANVLPPAS